MFPLAEFSEIGLVYPRTVEDILASEPLDPRVIYTTHEFKEKTLRDIDHLLIGMVVDGKRRTEFEFGDITPDLRIRIDDVEKSPEYENEPGRSVLARLSMALNSLCGRDFTDKKFRMEERIIFMSRLPVEDVAFLALVLEYLEQEGEIDNLPMGKRCPECLGPLMGVSGSMDSIPCQYIDWEVNNPPRAVMRLRNRLAWRQKEVDIGIFSPPTWGGTFCVMDRASWRNVSKTKLLFVVDSMKRCVFLGDKKPSDIELMFGPFRQAAKSQKEIDSMVRGIMRVSGRAEYDFTVTHRTCGREFRVRFNILEKDFFVLIDTE